VSFLPKVFSPPIKLALKPNNFTVTGYSTDHYVGNPNLTYVPSHDVLHSGFLSDDFESSNSLRGPPSARHNYPPLQIQPHEEPMFCSSRPSLVSSNFQSGYSPSLPQSPNVWANAPTLLHSWHSVTSKEEDGFMEYNTMEEEGYGYEYNGVSPTLRA